MVWIVATRSGNSEIDDRHYLPSAVYTVSRLADSPEANLIGPSQAQSDSEFPVAYPFLLSILRWQSNSYLFEWHATLRRRVDIDI